MRAKSLLLFTVFIISLINSSKCSDASGDDVLEIIDNILGEINDGLTISNPDFRGIVGIVYSEITDYRMGNLFDLIDKSTSGILGKVVILMEMILLLKCYFSCN